MKNCRWCKKTDIKFANSHIIPKAFFNHDGKNDRKIFTKSQHSKRRPVGSYDKEILCINCEKSFQQIDSQASNILLNNFDKNLIPFNNQKDEIALQISGQHKQALKRFLIYTLWKSSVSTLEEFQNVKLKTYYEEKIKNELIENKEFKDHEYSFSSYKVEKSSGNFYPRKLNKKNFSGCNYYQLDFANFIFNIKIDSIITPNLLKVFAEHKNIIFGKIYETPKKRRQAMAKILKSQK